MVADGDVYNLIYSNTLAAWCEFSTIQGQVKRLYGRESLSSISIKVWLPQYMRQLKHTLE